MAEAFSVAAGVFGVVSLSIQLAESVQKVKGFYANLKNAPPGLADLLDEIAEMSELIKELEQEQRSTSVVTGPLMRRCIESSLKAVEYFATFSVELDTRVKRRKIGGGVKFALGQEEIERMLNRVERAKSLLTLAYVQYQTALQQHQHDQMLQTLQSLSVSQAALLQLVTPALTVQGPVTSEAVVVPNHNKVSTKAKVLFGARTPAWLSNNIWQIALNRSISGWEFTMRTYGVVASDAPILKACEVGDSLAMQRLFDTRMASPFDQSEYGRSLWEYGIIHAKIDTLRLLLAYGFKPGFRKSSWGWFWYYALLWGHGGNDIQHDLRFLHEQFDDRQPVGPQDEHCNEEASRVALGPPIEVAFSEFWHTILYWGGLIKNDVPVPRPFTDLLTRYNSEHMHGYTQLQLLARYLGSALAISMRTACTPTNSRIDVEELIVAAISMGLDIHEGFPDKTPFQTMLSSFVTLWFDGDRPLNEGLEKALLKWLKILQRADIDLCGYGKAEERIRQEQRPIPHWSDSHDEGFGLPVSAIETFKFQFTYGPMPADWSVTLLDFVEECSGDFWRLVDAQAEEALFEKCVLPGGWVSV